jgi:hypothetical protein
MNRLMTALRTSSLWNAILKLSVLLIIIFIGLFVTTVGYDEALRPLPPETQPPFEVYLKPEYGPKWGDLKVSVQPEEAFVVGDHISTTVEIVPFAMPGETINVMIVFPESISILKEWAWTNTSSYEELIVLWGNSTFPQTTLRQELTLWYVHEGIFGVNVTMVRFGYPEPYDKFVYPDIVHIKSYSYLEERRNAQLTNALNARILGLTIIAVSPIVVQAVDLLEQIVDRARTKSENEG